MALFNLAKSDKPEEDKKLIKMAIRFKKHERPTDTDKMGVWFSKADLAAISVQIEESAPPGKTPSGVRIYIGKYHKNAKEYAGRISVVFIPTYKEFDAQGKEFHEDAVSDKDIQDAKREIAQGDHEADKLLDGYNHGQLCPPNCGKIAKSI